MKRRLERKHIAIFITFAFATLAGFAGCAADVKSFGRVNKPPSMLTEDQKDIMRVVKGNVLIDTDFTEPMEMQTLTKHPRFKESIVSGVIPKDWWENTAYALVDINYAVINDEHDLKDEKHLRIRSKRLKKTSPVYIQFRKRLKPSTEANPIYRLRMVTRGPKGVRFEYSFGGYKREVRFNGGMVWQIIEQTVRPRHAIEQGSDRIFSLIVRNQGLDEVFFDIKSVYLEEISPDDIDSAINIIYGDEYPENLMPVTRYPLGQASGVTIRHSSEAAVVGIVEAAPDVPGPSSGYPSLRIANDTTNHYDLQVQSKHWMYGITVFLGHFEVPKANERHVFSAYVKGKGRFLFHVKEGWRAVSMYPPRPKGAASLSRYTNKDAFWSNINTDDWIRIQIPFDPTLFGPPLNIFMVCDSPKGDSIYVADAKVEIGEKATPYRAQMPAELQARPEQISGIQFVGEDAPEILFGATGNIKGAVIKGFVENQYGDKRKLADTRLTETRMQKGRITFGDFKERPYGTYRVELRIEKDGTAISPTIETLVSRVRKPHAYDRIARDSMMGMHAGYSKSSLAMMKAIGFNWVRWVKKIGWKVYEPVKGEYVEFYTLPNAYKEARIAHLVHQVPPPAWAQMDYPDIQPGTSAIPKNTEDVSNYAYQMTSKYSVAGYEGMNEPFYLVNVHMQKGIAKGGSKPLPPDNPVAEHTRIQKAIYEGVKAASPGIPVLGICGTLDSRFITWAEKCFNDLGGKYMDAISYHCYEYGKGVPGSTTLTELEHGYAHLKGEDGKPFPLWMTEGSPIRKQSQEGMLTRITIPKNIPRENYDENADRMVRYFTLHIAGGAKKLFIYHLEAHGMYDPGEESWRLGITSQGYPHPVGVAISAIAYFMDFRAFDSYEEIAPGVFVFFFDGSEHEKSTTAVIMLDNTRMPLPDYTLSLGKKARIYDKYGNTLSANTKLGKYALFLEFTGTIDEAKSFFK